MLNSTAVILACDKLSSTSARIFILAWQVLEFNFRWFRICDLSSSPELLEPKSIGCVSSPHRKILPQISIGSFTPGYVRYEGNKALLMNMNLKQLCLLLELGFRDFPPGFQSFVEGVVFIWNKRPKQKSPEYLGFCCTSVDPVGFSCQTRQEQIDSSISQTAQVTRQPLQGSA